MKNNIQRDFFNEMSNTNINSNINHNNNSSLLDNIINNDNYSEITDNELLDVDELEEPTLAINMEEVNENATDEAKEITERLSGYYFDQKYINTHPYIPIKIKCEMNNIRRLIKMLEINEHAQDALIKNISYNAGKGALYSALTSLQNSTLSIQSQLNTLTEKLEDIFKKMQDECEKTWSDKEKEERDDGTVTVRGSREFIEMLTKRKTGTNE